MIAFRDWTEDAGRFLIRINSPVYSQSLPRLRGESVFITGVEFEINLH